MENKSWLEELTDISYAPKYTDQGSDYWEKIRAGRFTSSEWYKIMQCGTRPMTEAELKDRPKTGKGSATKTIPDPSQMGKAGITYIRQKVSEVLTGMPKRSAYAYPLVYGKETEPEAVEYFEKITGKVCEDVGFQPFGDHAGGSPDRLIGDDEGLEIKCPYEPENQIGYLLLTDHYDLKREYPEYYWQCVSLMFFTGRNTWHFCTYDPRMIDEKHKLTHIVITRDKVEDDIDMIIKALAGAVKEKLSLLQTLNA
jgi:YqaJ-like viral recombinase domain